MKVCVSDMIVINHIDYILSDRDLNERALIKEYFYKAIDLDFKDLNELECFLLECWVDGDSIFINNGNEDILIYNRGTSLWNT